MREQGKRDSLSFDSAMWNFDTSRTDVRFLGLHSLDDIKGYVVRSGLDRHLRKKGLYPYLVNIGIDDDGQWLLLITLPEENQLPLVDFRVSRVRKSGIAGTHVPFDFLKIEWLSTYDPTLKDFCSKRPRLPGQKVPGLGCLRHLLKMMHLSSRMLRVDGFLDIPEYLHLAIMYSKRFKFLDPEFEKQLRVLLSDMKSETLFRLSWAAVCGAIIDRTSEQPWNYDPGEQAFAISGKLRTYFQSRSYSNEYKKKSAGPFYIDERIYSEKLEEVMGLA